MEIINLQLFASQYDERNQQNQQQAAAVSAGTDRSAAAVPASGTTGTTQSTSNATASHTTTQAAQPYSGMNGVSANTAQNLANYQQGYNASSQVQNALNYLNNLQNNAPGQYLSQYQDQMNNILGQIGDYTNGNKPFEYSLNGDMLYQQYKDMYQQNGKQAMMDTMGNAASLTGGYGSSYGTNAGYQAYQQYLTQMNGAIPDFYDRAYQRYGDDFNRLNTYYGDLMGAEQNAYNQYNSDYNNYLQNLNSANSIYGTLHNADYSQYSDALSYWNNLANSENGNWRYTNTQAYNTVMSMLQAGAMPSADLLAAANISQADANSMFSALHPPAGPGGGGAGTKKQLEDLQDEYDKYVSTHNTYRYMADDMPADWVLANNARLRQSK